MNMAKNTAERYLICDCGQIYSSVAALQACADTAHVAAAGNELADAEDLARRWGEPIIYENDERP